MRIMLLAITSVVTLSQFASAIAHDTVQPIRDTVANAPGSLVKKFQPFLFTDYSCVPFPAVNAQGEVGDGLQATGYNNGKCKHSVGQVYSRVGSSHGRRGIMYAWYFPKDQYGDIILQEGYRHEWLSVILWLNDPMDSEVVSISRWNADAYVHETRFRSTQGKPWIEKGYEELYTDTKRQGPVQPLIDWDSMPSAAKTALNSFVFGERASQKCPINDGYFQIRMDEAFTEM